MRKLAVVLVVACAMIYLYGQIDYTVAPFKTWDLASYRVMAAAAPRLAADVCQPPAYRLLGPYVVGLLPLADPVGFYALAALASLALVVLARHFFMALGLSPWVATLAVILFTFNRFWFGLTVWDFFQLNDLLSLIWIVILFLALMKDRWALFGVVLLLGALTRETSLLMIPVALAYLWEKKQLRARWRHALLAFMPALAAFVAIRVFVPAPCGQPLFDQLAAHSRSILAPEKIFRLTINSYIPFSLLPFVFLPTTVAFFKPRRHALLFVALVFASTLFGLSFDERLMAPAFLMVYAVIGFALQDALHAAQPAAKGRNAFLVALIAGGFAASLHHQVARFPLPDRTWTMALSLGALAVVTAAALWLRLRRAQANEI